MKLIIKNIDEVSQHGFLVELLHVLSLFFIQTIKTARPIILHISVLLIFIKAKQQAEI